jgi:hypothetical protein
MNKYVFFKEVAYAPKSMLANMIVVSDAETVVGYGNAFASMVEKANSTFGDLIWIEYLICFVASIVHLYLFTPITSLALLWEPGQIAFLVCFCSGNFVSALCFQLRMSSLSRLGQSITDKMCLARQSLREFTILKLKKLSPNDLSEITELRERFGDSKYFKPGNYFKLNRSSLLMFRIIIVNFVILLFCLK